MKLKRIGLGMMLCLGGCVAMFGQEYKDYDLSTYKLPDIVRNQLDFSLKSSGSFDAQNTEEDNAFGIDGNFQTTFDRYKNTRLFRGTQRLGLELGGMYDKNNQGEKKRNYQIGMSYKNQSRFYNTNQLFFETGVDLYFDMDGNKAFGNSQNSSKLDLLSLNVSIPLRVGKGRIERVEDARQAIYILDNLSKRKVLDRRLTNEEIDEFARLISTVKNERFFDSRLRMVDEITTVDSFLVKNNLLAFNGPAYFTTLYDYWMYGSLFERGSGTEISGGLRPGVTYDYNKYKDVESIKMISPSLMADVSLCYEKPVNLYWQHSAELSLNALYRLQDHRYKNQVNYDNKWNNYSANLIGNYEWGYYPNSRTNINWGVHENLGWDKYVSKENSGNERSLFRTTSQAYMEMYYYFSPQLRLALQGSVLFLYERQLEPVDAEQREHTRWSGNFMATLTYSLF